MMPPERDGDRTRARVRRKMCMWAIASLFMVLVALSAVGHRKATARLGHSNCPRHWAGASDKFVGSCWCGWDQYCMCTPSLAIDSVVELEDPDTNEVESILVVRRKDNGKLACIGGFVEVGETLPEAVRREVWEETGLEVISWRMIPRVYDEPDRDARRHTVSVAYVVRTKGTPIPESEEESVVSIPLESLRDRLHEFAFDHSLILTDYLAGMALTSPQEAVVSPATRESGVPQHQRKR